MIKNLRRKFILISMLSMLLVLAVIMGIANTINYRKIVSQADRLTTILAENDGAFGEPFKMPQKSETMENQQEQGERKHPMEFSPETPFSTRFFFVKFDDNGTVQECDVSKIAAVDEEQAKSLGQEILKKESGVGFSDVYRYRVADTDEGKIVIFVDIPSLWIISKILLKLVQWFHFWDWERYSFSYCFFQNWYLNRYRKLMKNKSVLLPMPVMN